MKRPLILVFLLAIISTSSGQEYAIGIKGGLNYFNIGDINSRGSTIQSGLPDEVFSPNNEMNTHFGAFINVAFGNFFIRPEVNFGSIKNSYDFPVQTSQWETSKVDIPILIGYKIYDPVAIYAGPTFSFMDEVTLEGANNDFGKSPITYESNISSLSVGILIEFKRFGIDFRYSSAFKDIEEIPNNMNRGEYGINVADLYAYRPGGLSLSLNIFLFRTDGDEISDIFSNLFKGKGCNCYN